MLVDGWWQGCPPASAEKQVCLFRRRVDSAYSTAERVQYTYIAPSNSLFLIPGYAAVQESGGMAK